MVETYSFSKAIDMVEMGYRMARLGWNGNNMCIFYTEGSNVPYEKCKKAVQDALVCARSEEIGDMLRMCSEAGTDPIVKINPHIDLVCDDGSITCGWVASQSDMLSNDWVVVQ